jgi:hypothetical protein
MILPDWTELARRGTCPLGRQQRSSQRVKRDRGWLNVEGLEQRSLLTVPALTVTGATLKAHYKKEFTAVVGTVTTSDVSASTHDFHVTINWGDGATSSGKLEAKKHDKGTFNISGTHKYSSPINNEEPEITVTETHITDAQVAKPAVKSSRKSGKPEDTSALDAKRLKTSVTKSRGADARVAKPAATSVPGLSAEAYAQVDVAGAPLTFNWVASQVTIGEPVQGVVATLTSSSTNVKSVNVSLDIAYPDGSSEAITFVQDPANPEEWQASASGVYSFPTSTSSPDQTVHCGVSGSVVEQAANASGRQVDQTVPVNLSQTVEVDLSWPPDRLTAYTPPNQTPLSGSVNVPLTVHLFFLDTNVDAELSDYDGTIDWEDGTTPTELSSSNFQFVGKVDGEFEVEVTAVHTYSYQGTGSYAITANIFAHGYIFGTPVFLDDVELQTTASIGGGLIIQLGGLASTLQGQDIRSGLVPPPSGTPPFTVNTTEQPPFTSGTYNPNYLELPLAYFNAAPYATPSNYTGWINWGDGTAVSQAIIQYLVLDNAPDPPPVSNTLAVYYPEHEYASAGVFSVTVTITGEGFTTTSAPMKVSIIAK